MVTKETCYSGASYAEHPWTVINEEEVHGGKLIIIVSEQTQSLAEAIAGALSTASGAPVVGSQTSGADGDVSWFTFLKGVSSFLNGLGAFYPDGTPTHRRGIRIDMRVVPTIDGTRRDEDEVLIRAIELLAGNNRQRALKARFARRVGRVLDRDDR